MPIGSLDFHTQKRDNPTSHNKDKKYINKIKWNKMK